MNANTTFKNIRHTLAKHSPGILTGIGIAGMITSTGLAIKATPKAIIIVNDLKDELETEDLPIKEVVKATWKCYIPTAVTTLFSTSCLIGATSVHSRRNAAIATAYKLSEAALNEYKHAVIETIGEKKEKQVRDKVAEKQINKNPVSKNEVIITEKGNTLCYDSISGRYFKSDIEKIRKAENAFDRKVAREDYGSLNELYDEFGIDHTKIGDEIGWRIDDGLIDLSFSSQIADDGTPCIVINYGVPPRYGFNSFY